MAKCNLNKLTVSVAVLLITFLIPPAAYSQGFFSLSEEQELELGRQTSIEVEKEYPILNDAGVTQFVNQMGQDLVRRSGRRDIQYYFKVVDSKDINAFALPGGYIYLNRGVLEAADSEAEVAGVLAHEIGHVVARHSAEQVAKMQLAGLGLGVLGAILGDGGKSQMANMAAQMVTSGVFMKYSREAEREADRLGAQNMYDAGYDPSAMVTFFNKLADGRQTEPNAVEGFFASHPSPNERAGNVSDLIASFPDRRAYRSDSRAFVQTKQSLASVAPTPPTAASTGPVTSGRRDRPTTSTPSPAPTSDVRAIYREESQDRKIAALYAPVFHVGVTRNARYDLPTSFDFDGDQRADNNWQNADSSGYRPRGYVYYNLSETETHYLINYTLFFPVDDKRVFESQGEVHENDMESCLVVVEKSEAGTGRVVVVEVLGEEGLRKYIPNAALLGGFESIRLQEGRPPLFVDPKGHRIMAFRGDEVRNLEYVRDLLSYEYAGRADDPTQARQKRVGYELVSLHGFWKAAQTRAADIFMEQHDYGRLTVKLLDRGQRTETTVNIGRAGTTFRTGVRNQTGGALPWALSDPADKEIGRWFLDPAWIVGQHFRLRPAFSRHYVHNPMLEIYR
jgi:Zn-dependent protease with chaperone function